MARALSLTAISRAGVEKDKASLNPRVSARQRSSSSSLRPITQAPRSTRSSAAALPTRTQGRLRKRRSGYAESSSRAFPCRRRADKPCPTSGSRARWFQRDHLSEEQEPQGAYRRWGVRLPHSPGSKPEEVSVPPYARPDCPVCGLSTERGSQRKSEKRDTLGLWFLPLNSDRSDFDQLLM